MTAPWRPPTVVPTPIAASITPRQADVLTGLHLGLTNAQIGKRLGGLSEETIRTHASGLFKALGARDRCHAVALTSSPLFTVHVRDVGRNFWSKS